MLQHEPTRRKLFIAALILLQLYTVIYYTGLYEHINVQFHRFQLYLLKTSNRFNYKVRRDDEVLQEILANPIYSKFGFKPAARRKQVTVLIIVSSGPRRYDRRQAIRETWWTECKPLRKVIPECIFMTDIQRIGDEYYNIVTNESNTYRDLRFQNLEGGVQFGKRFLHHMVYATMMYEFDYFLRVDDDYFFCMNNFLQELPVPMLHNFHWGWVHCDVSMTRPEESMILLSRDVFMKFLLQDYRSMMCHPLADQMIGVWSTYMDMTYLFRHDRRLHHESIVSEEPQLRYVKNICHHFMGIHGAYPDDLRLLWTHRGSNISVTGDLHTNSNVCKINGAFRWYLFSDEWYYEPKLCLDDPVWDTSKLFVLNGSYSGRQDVDKEPV